MIYFDHAATSFPKSRIVSSAIQKSIKECGNSGRSGHIYALKSAETVFKCRKKLAALFNTKPECVIFTSGATEALNIAIKGTNYSGGVTVVSSMEHNSVMRPLNTLRRKGETILKQFSVDVKSDGITLENFSVVSRIATNVVVTHASNVCGRILPIKQLRSLVDKDAVFILDASQTAGHIPMDIVDLGVDIMCVPGHKGLFGPMGVGALIINPYRDILIEPLLEGGTGSNSKSYDMPELYPERLEAGTVNVYGIAGLSAALDELNFETNEKELYGNLLEKLQNMVDITLYGSPEGNLQDYVPVLLLNKKGFDSEALADILSEKGIAVRGGYHCAPNAHQTIGTFDIGGVRVSLGRTNTQREIDRFVSILQKIKDRK